MAKPMTRRQVLIAGARFATLLVPTSFMVGCGSGGGEQAAAPGGAAVAPTAVVDEVETRLRQELIQSSRMASAGGQWGALEFNNLIDSLGEDSLKRTCRTLEIPQGNSAIYESTTAMKSEVRRVVLGASRFLPGGDPENISYHEEVVLPTASKLELASFAEYDTLSVERAIYNHVFSQHWTTLTENERLGFLDQSGWGLSRSDAVSLAALTGSGILAGLGTAVNLAGFSFYTGMSSGLHALAVMTGLPVPFAVYTGLSTAVGVATSAVGWIIAALLAGAGIYAWLKRNQQSSEATLLRTVLHVHNFRVSAMEQAGISFAIQGV